MLSVYDQENLTTTHARNAAAKPLNHSLQALQLRTPGQNLVKASRSHNDENITAKSKRVHGPNAFVTPAPQKRAPLGAKPTNTTVKNFKTPSVFAKSAHPRENTETPAPVLTKSVTAPASTTRRSAKRKIYVRSEEAVSTTGEIEEDDTEPEVDSAPPPIIPLPDPPIEFNYDQTFPWAQSGNSNRGVGPLYFRNPEGGDEDSDSETRLQQRQQESLKHAWKEFSQEAIPGPLLDPEEEEAIITASFQPQTHTVRVRDAAIDTLRARQANSALSRLHGEPRSRPGKSSGMSQARLPSACQAQTAASKSKQKSSQATAKDNPSSVPVRVSRNTIGFPKARKAAPVANIFPIIEVDECMTVPTTTHGGNVAPISRTNQSLGSNPRNKAARLKPAHKEIVRAGDDGGLAGSSQESAFGRINGDDEIDVDEELQFKINGLEAEDFQL